MARQTAIDNVYRRFGDPLRVQIVKSRLGPAEARYQQDKIFSAYLALLRDLGRTPVEKEIYGLEEIKDKDEVLSNV